MKKIYCIAALFTTMGYQIYAQCAMCRATVETHARSAENKVVGLNTAILYLLVIPYLCAGILWYVWRSNKKKIDAQNQIIKDRIAQAGK